MDKRLRVLQIFKYYHPHIGGVEKVAQDIAEGLRDHIESTVLVCHNNRHVQRDVVNGIQVVRAGALATYFSVPLSPGFPFLMRRMARDADILHFHLPFPLGDVSYLLARPKGKIVVWWHSQIVRPKRISKLYEPLLVQFLKKVERIIVAAPQLIENPVLARFREKCVVIPIGIDLCRLTQAAQVGSKVQQIRDRHGRKIILFVGRLIYYKGLDYLLQAMGDQDAVLLIIGEGPLEHDLKSRVIEQSISRKVVFLGKVSNEELVDYYHACDLLVLPSVENTEAFGIVQLEAMACGKPVVSTDLPTGVPFVNQHGKTGLIVPARDVAALGGALSRLLNDAALRKRLGVAARERVEREFSKGEMLNKVFSLYRETLGCGEGKRAAS